jgi:hypothetical protein
MMRTPPNPRGLRWLTLALPLVFALHVAEEAPAFVTWFNSLVHPPISQRLFLSVNAWALAITLLVTVVLLAVPNEATGLLAVAWVALLMLANGVFHAAATLVHARYCPGVVTGILVYVPFAVAFIRTVQRELSVPLAGIAVAVVVGSFPMLVHGYLIVFRGSRLF